VTADSISPPPRLASLDAYRGWVMLLMMAEVLSLALVAANHPGSFLWAFVADQQTHTEWVGCSLHDIIQPSFSFLVGAALPFSLASRRAKGQGTAAMLGHAARRAVILVVLGIVLRSFDRQMTYFTFEDTLSQIGLGYVILFWLGLRPERDQWIALVVLLAGYWAAFALYPLPGPGFDWTRAGVSPDWPHQLTGFAAHWNKNTNPAWAFDTWFLNLFPRESPFTNNGGGYATLSFIPTLATMILGLAAGRWLKADLHPGERIRKLFIAGAVTLALGLLLHVTGLCPIVKRIWTPSWTLASGGICFWLTAIFYEAIDRKGGARWAFPLVVVGANSIAAYVIAHTIAEPIGTALHTHFGRFDLALGGPAAPLVHGACILFAEWGVLYWMYRRRIFIKI
jgi:predicted acyltransferase